VPLDTVSIAADDCATDVLELDEALERLSRFDDRLGRVVEYRFFGGLTYEEIAAVTGVSVATVKRDWVRARTWLFRALRQ
jgi:RNA polymerase sigma factor (sigma-70 family)